jgi:hypothetical protein
VANYVYELPFYKEQHGLVGHTLGGWELSGITQFISGESQTVTQALDPFDCQATPAGSALPCAAGTYPGGLNMDASDIAPRPDQVAPVKLTKTQGQWFTVNSFADAVGHFGSAGDGAFLGPGEQLWDLSAIKNVRIGERYRLQFRGEFFNAFNHNSFNTIQTSIDAANVGQVTSVHNPREIQLGGKFNF